MKELGISSGTNLNSTYINEVNTVDELIQTDATALADVFDIKLQQKEKNVPQIYWIPKFHKTPYNARFIAFSRSCTTTRLSKLITGCLKTSPQPLNRLLKGQVLKACGSSIIRCTLSVHWRKNSFH